MEEQLTTRDQRQTDSNREHRCGYKPTALQWPFLTALLAVLLCTLVFVAYAARTLPVIGTHTEHHGEGRGLDTTTEFTTKHTQKLATTPGSTEFLQSFQTKTSTRIITPAHPITIPTKTHEAPKATLAAKMRQTLKTILVNQSSPVSPAPTALTPDAAPSGNFGRIGFQTVSIAEVFTEVEVAEPSSNTPLQVSYRLIDTIAITSPPTFYTVVYYISPGQYLAGMFLPTTIASFIAIFVRIIAVNANIFQPWHALTDENGASGHDSLYLPTGGWQSIVMNIRSLFRGQVVISSTNILLLSSAILVPLSAEAVALDPRGDGCKRGASEADNCVWVLSVSSPTSKAAIALLIFMSIVTTWLLFLLKRWRLGVYTNPWSICALASLSLNHEVRQFVVGTKRSLGDQNVSFGEGLKFRLGYFQHANGKREYGIVASDDAKSDESLYQRGVNSTTVPLDNNSSKKQQRMPFFILRYPGRLLLLFLISGVLILVLYYSQTGGDTGFEKFIDADTFGVRFLFTSFGVIIGFLWSSFYEAVAILSQYRLLASKPQNTSRSILLAPPTNAFSGLWHAIRTRRVFLGVTGLASVLSEFLGIFLSNVPFQVTQTHLVCLVSIWTTVGILSFMVLLIITSFFISWPDMPVDPSTIIGAMYYIHDSPMLDKFEGLSILDRKERDHRVMELGLLYEFSYIRGISGRFGMSVNVVGTDREIT
ncbi:hypothetical protein F5Y10DRAFT_285311 [Nemania abortiva]|nr:hypothetical protein F5Y10DRAFT_285311 [Nemania abortiva]